MHTVLSKSSRCLLNGFELLTVGHLSVLDESVADQLTQYLLVRVTWCVSMRRWTASPLYPSLSCDLIETGGGKVLRPFCVMGCERSFVDASSVAKSPPRLVSCIENLGDRKEIHVSVESRLNFCVRMSLMGFPVSFVFSRFLRKVLLSKLVCIVLAVVVWI